MKLIGLSFVMVGLLLTGCRKPVVQTEDSSALEPMTITQASPAPAAQTTSSARTVIVPLSDTLTSAPPRELAPPGVFYLLVAVRKDTRDGIVRLLPGTEVQLGKRGKYITPEGEMALNPNILTNDMAQARIARRADKLAQASAYPQALPLAPAASAIPVAPSATSAPPAATNPIAGLFSAATPVPQADDAKVRAMKFRLSVLKADEAKLQANLDFLSEKAFHPYSKTAPAPTGLNGSTNLTDWNLINDKLAAVRTEIQALEAKLGITSN